MVHDNSGVRVPALCPSLKVVLTDKTGEVKADDVADCNKCECVSWGGDLTPSVGGNLIASKAVSSDPMYTVKARGGGATKWLRL